MKTLLEAKLTEKENELEIVKNQSRSAYKLEDAKLLSLVLENIVSPYFSFELDKITSAKVDNFYGDQCKVLKIMGIRTAGSYSETLLEITTKGDFKINMFGTTVETNSDSFEMYADAYIRCGKRLESIKENKSQILEAVIEVLENEEYLELVENQKKLNFTKRSLEVEINNISKQLKFDEIIKVGNKIELLTNFKGKLIVEDSFIIDKITAKSILTRDGRRLKLSDIKDEINSYRLVEVK